MPNFSKIKFENVKCPICKSGKYLTKLFSAPDRLTNLPGIFYLARCQKCTLTFQSPRPKEEYIHYYYPDTIGYFNPEAAIPSKLSLKIDTLLLINFYNYTNLGKANFLLKILLFPVFYFFYKHHSIPQFKKNGKLLEVGCSNGNKLKKLTRLGWDTTGIEINNASANNARKQGMHVKTGSIFDFNFEEQYFDVIILDMVMEHIYDPALALKNITSWLKPGGELIFSIPYFEGIEFKIFKEHSYGLQLPTHITFFNKKTIYLLLKKDFASIKFAFHHFDRDIVASAHYKYTTTNNFFYKIIAYNKFIRWIFIKPLVFTLSIFQKTSRATIFATKR
jgi:SAM-dependent methyltransferase